MSGPKSSGFGRVAACKQFSVDMRQIRVGLRFVAHCGNRGMVYKQIISNGFQEIVIRDPNRCEAPEILWLSEALCNSRDLAADFS
jgi:hypothetical protein